MFSVRNRDREFSIGEPPELADNNVGDVQNFNPKEAAHVKQTIGDLIVLLNDVGVTELNGGAVPLIVDTVANAEAARDLVHNATDANTAQNAAGGAGAGRAAPSTVYSKFIQVIEAERARLAGLPGAAPGANPAFTPITLFDKLKSLLSERKKLILNLIDAAVDIDGATASKNGKVINDENKTTNGFNAELAENELNNLLRKTGFAPVAGDPAPAVMGANVAVLPPPPADNAPLRCFNLINILRFHYRDADQKVETTGTNNLAISRLQLLGNGFAVPAALVPLGIQQTDFIFNGNRSDVYVLAAQQAVAVDPAAAPGGAFAGAGDVAIALEQLRTSLLAIPNKAAFLKTFGASIPGSLTYNLLTSQVVIAPAVDIAAVPNPAQTIVRNTHHSIIDKLQNFFNATPAAKSLFGLANGVASPDATVNGVDVASVTGQAAVINTLRRIYQSLPTAAANTPAHRLLAHIVWAPTNIKRVPEGFRWASAKEFLGVLALTDADKKGLAAILSCSSEEVIPKISRSPVFIKALKDLQDYTTTVQLKKFKNDLAINTFQNMNLGSLNPQMLRFMNIIRRKATPQTMANVGVPGSISIAIPGMLPGFPPGMLGGAMVAPPTDFPIEMRGGGYNIGMMKGGYSGLIGPFRPITDESFISSSLDAAIQSLKDRITSGKGSLSADTTQKIDGLVESLKKTETQVKNNRDNLIAMNNAISTGRFKPEDGHVYTAKEIATVAKTYNEVNKMRQSLENKLTRVMITLNGVTQSFQN